MNKIITTFDAKPIPSRSFDWVAHRDSYEGGDPIGTGETKEKAIENLKELEDCEE